MDEIFKVDQYRIRDAFSQASQAGQKYEVPTVPFRLFKTPPHFGGSVSDLGQDTATWKKANKETT